jgi:hypothetical protein
VIFVITYFASQDVQGVIATISLGLFALAMLSQCFEFKDGKFQRPWI